MTEPPDHDDDDDAPLDGDAEDEDEKFDLEDLDELGVDGVVAQLSGDEASGAGPARRPGWVSAIVLIASLGLLVWLWPDFRFWTLSSDPVQIGAAQDWVDGGKVPDGWVNAYVELNGTPNVKWAMLRGTGDGEQRSFFDIVEAPGQLFVLTPQVSGEHETRKYKGHWTGRLLRLGDDEMAMTRMAHLYAQENVTRAIDVAPQALADARAAEGLTFATENEGTIELAPEDAIRFVVQEDNKRVLLGGLSFRNGEEAEAAVAELGYPYFRLPDLMPPEDPRAALSKTPGGEAEPPKKRRPDTYRFVVKIPVGGADAAREQLAAKMIREPDPADHRTGVSVFKRQATYLAPAGSVTIAGQDVLFPYGENATAPGYVVKDGKLVERPLDNGRMRIPLSALAEVRLEKPIVVDPDGYLLVDGYTPGDAYVGGIGFLGVLAVALVNAGLLLFGLMRRR